MRRILVAARAGAAKPVSSAIDTTLPLAVAAMACFGVADLLYKRAAAAGVPAHRFMMVQTWMFVPSVIFYGVVTGTLTFVPGSAWGSAAGLFMYTGFYNFARSLRQGSISVNAPIFRLSLVITAALAIAFFGEPVTPYKVGGIALAIAAMWLLLGSAEDARSAKVSRDSIIAVIVATVAVGIANFVHKLGLSTGATPASLVVAQAAVVSTTATLVSRSIDRRIVAPRAVWGYALLPSVALTLAFVSLVESMQRGQASVVVPIAQMGFVVTALVGFVFLKEPVTGRKMVGLAVALTALASLAHG